VLFIRHAPAHDLALAALRSLEAAGAGFWDALAWEGYRDVDEAGLGQPAVPEYQALLAQGEDVNLSRHGWLLREVDIAAVYNLVRAQRRLWQVCAALPHCWPEPLAHALRADTLGVAYWPFVLLHTARRRLSGPALPGEERHHPARLLPYRERWLQAWFHAAVMEASPVIALLLGQDPPRSPDDLLCPPSWDG
jgi:hypothetical protein